jgi:Flp pilus assembly protein TadG
MRRHVARRSGATLVESAIVLPVLFILMLILVVGAMGVFRYLQVASLAREAARYASVHGSQYAADNNKTAATQTDIQNYVAANCINMDTTQLTTSVSWNTDEWQYHNTMDANNNFVPVQNIVTVTVTYYWLPEMYLGGITLSSTSNTPMSY